MYTITQEMPRLTRMEVFMALDQESCEAFDKALKETIPARRQALFKKAAMITEEADRQFDLYMQESRRARCTN